MRLIAGRMLILVAGGKAGSPQDDDWLAASEIAKRVGRTRQSIGLLVRGDRGPGGLPAPVARYGSPNSIVELGRS